MRCKRRSPSATRASRSAESAGEPAPLSAGGLQPKPPKGTHRDHPCIQAPLAIFAVLGGLLIASTPAGATDPDSSSPRGDADKSKAVIVLIGANDYGFADTVPSRSPEHRPQ